MQINHQPLVKRLTVIAVAMFGFGYLLVPLYDVFCDVTGLNGKAANQRVEIENVQELSHSSRQITVEFVAIVNAGRPWEFAPKVHKMRVPVGKLSRTQFSAKNLGLVDRVAQAVPSVSPGLASKHLNKIECFCFNRQPLAAGQLAELPLLFMVDDSLPDKITTITLTYTLFDITETAQKSLSLRAVSSKSSSHLIPSFSFLLENSERIKPFIRPERPMASGALLSRQWARNALRLVGTVRSIIVSSPSQLLRYSIEMLRGRYVSFY